MAMPIPWIFDWVLPRPIRLAEELPYERKKNPCTDRDLSREPFGWEERAITTGTRVGTRVPEVKLLLK
jgi:hypothetical protein